GASLRASPSQRVGSGSGAFVPARVGEGEDASDRARSPANADAGAIYMGAGQAEELATALVAAGKAPDTPIAIVENASLAQSHTIFATLGSLPRVVGQSSGPAVILIGPQYKARAQTVRDSVRDDDGVTLPRQAGTTA